MSDPKFRGYTIFCDDIRLEADNKITFVGTYNGAMFIHGGFPASLPKFAVAVTYQEKRGECSEEDVTLLVYMPGDPDDKPSITAPIPMKEIREKVPPLPETDDLASDPTRYLSATMHMVFSPLNLSGPGAIKVRAQCGSETIKLGSLVITQHPNGQLNATASQQPS